MAAGVLRRVIDQFVRRLPDPSLSGRLEDLSERETEVLALIGAGLSNPEIAEHLFISIATVKSHVRHILAKLDLRDRVQAVVLAHETGWSPRTRRCPERATGHASSVAACVSGVPWTTCPATSVARSWSSATSTACTSATDTSYDGPGSSPTVTG